MGLQELYHPSIEERCAELIVSDEKLARIRDLLLIEINQGLGKKTNRDSTVKCFPTYVRDLPNGEECGKFLALDLGGTNFRVLLIELGPHIFHMESKIFAVPQSIMLGPGTELFDHIAECLATFMHENKVDVEKLPLGFTFSFACSQEGLTKARLATWSKGFRCAGVEGEDVVQLLKEAIARRGDIQIDVMAVLNDTTGTLMACAWKNLECRIGLIVGTGTNACYVERLDAVETWEPSPGDGVDDGPAQMIVNTEWGAFGDNGCLDFIRTEHDRAIDQASLNPGRQLYEKMISGMYMGEVTRLVLAQLTREGLLFDGMGPELLFEPGQFFTKYLSEIESDKKGDYSSCRRVLEDLGLEEASDEDCANVRYVCEAVSRRAAHIAAAGVACLINKMSRPHVTVAVDGSVYRFHPHFHDLMVDQIQKLINPGLTFDLMLSEDGSGRGAALVAAVAVRVGRSAR